MSGRDVCLVAGTVIACGAFGYLWTKRQTGLTAILAILPQSNPPSRTSEKHIHENADEEASLNGNDVDEDRGPVDGQWYDAVILHALQDTNAARKCQSTLLEQIKLNVPNLQIGLPDDIITPGTPILDGFGRLLSSCRLVIIFHSVNFHLDDFMLYGKQINIIQSLKDPHKKNRIIPFIVDEADIADDILTIQPVDYIRDIGSDRFSNFKTIMIKLFLQWRNNIP